MLSAVGPVGELGDELSPGRSWRLRACAGGALMEDQPGRASGARVVASPGTLTIADRGTPWPYASTALRRLGDNLPRTGTGEGVRPEGDG